MICLAQSGRGRSQLRFALPWQSREGELHTEAVTLMYLLVKAVLHVQFLVILFLFL